MANARVDAVRSAAGALLVCLLVQAAAGEESRWLTDYAAARAQAKAEHKYLLLEFTASDWCPACVALKKEVFDLAEFQSAAVERFVLVELDFPSKKELPKKLKEQNEALGKQFSYRMHGFPTVLLLDEDEHVITRTGYRDVGVKPYLEHLDELVSTYAGFNKLIRQAENAEGVQRAKLLDEVVERREGMFAQDMWQVYPDEYPMLHICIDRLGYSIAGLRKELAEKDNEQSAAQLKWMVAESKWLQGWEEKIAKWMKEIPKLDPDNQAGLKTKYELLGLLRQAGILEKQHHDMWTFGYEAPKLLARAAELPGLKPEQKQLALVRQAVWYFGHFDCQAAATVLEKALAAAPQSEHADDVAERLKDQRKEIQEAEANVKRLKAELEKTKEIPARLKLLQELIGTASPLAHELPYAEKLAWEQEIVERDTDNSTGLRDIYAKANPRLGSLGLGNALLRQKFTELESICDKALQRDDWKAEELQSLHFFKAIGSHARGDRAGCLDQLRQASDAAQDSEYATKIAKIVERVNGEEEK